MINRRIVCLTPEIGNLYRFRGKHIVSIPVYENPGENHISDIFVSKDTYLVALEKREGFGGFQSIWTRILDSVNGETGWIMMWEDEWEEVGHEEIPRSTDR